MYDLFFMKNKFNIVFENVYFINLIYTNGAAGGHENSLSYKLYI